jgi:hypothetical protein
VRQSAASNNCGDCYGAVVANAVAGEVQRDDVDREDG